MCGIAGWLGTLLDGEQHAARFAEALHHRGPDGNDIRSWPEATLVHTRLSIIDLSRTGSQPMANEDGTIWTVFNGEIYNHRSLRYDLKARGHLFRGHSDTEVIPHLYEEYGTDFVEKLRGMFAFAIYDVRAHKLLLVRDRFGVKPLFFAPNNERLAFASEINALLTLPDIDARPNRQAISDFAALFFIPAPETFYRGIRALEPGQMLMAQMEERGGVSWKIHRYHNWTVITDDAITLTQAVEQADELVTAAVHRQLESDVPLGSLLSGGIDSSLISAAAQTAVGGGLQTFNVRFREKQYDESWAAELVAQQIGSHHQSFEMNSAPRAWETIVGLLDHCGQPFADTSLFAVNAVCRLMRQHVKVALSGDGGDEGFGGYDFYRWIASINRLQVLPPFIWRSASKLLAPLARVGAFPASLPQRLGELSDADDTTVIQNMFCWVRGREHQDLCRDRQLLPVRRLFEPQWNNRLPSEVSHLERLSAHLTEANVRLLLANDYLFKVDIASMKESLEVRVPMLDEDLFAFGLSLPHRLKVRGTTCKVVLRKVAERKLPRTIANKPKWGFNIPVDSWVDDEFKARMRTTLLGPSSKLPEFFHPEAYRPIIEAFCKGQPYPTISRQGIYQRAIMLLSVHLAMNRNHKSDNTRPLNIMTASKEKFEYVRHSGHRL